MVDSASSRVNLQTILAPSAGDMGAASTPAVDGTALRESGLRAAYRPAYMEENKTFAGASARRILPLILDLLHPQSVLDVGCGTGTWLAALRAAGIYDVVGIDGRWIDRAALEIPVDRFLSLDLERPFDLHRRFDLALSLEVGEHLAPEAADHHVASLVRHSSAVLFSAAIPFQGGSHHTNEQWPSYWAERFRRHGFEPIDCVRAAVWDLPDVAWWYSQNTILYVERSRVDGDERLRRARAAAQSMPMDLVHPRKFLQAADTGRLGALEMIWLLVNWLKRRGSGRRGNPRAR